MKKHFILGLLLIGFLPCAKAQVNLESAAHVKEPLWSLNTVTGNKESYQDPFIQVLEKPGWMYVASSGHLIFRGAGKIKGIEPNEGELAWNSRYTEDLPLINPLSFNEIPNTPYFSVVDRKGKKGQFIMSSIDGTIAANTGEDGLTDIYSRHILAQAGKILYIGRAKGSPVFACYDLKDPSKKWVKEKIFKYYDPVSTPLEVSDHEFVIATDFNVYKIDSKTGDIIWKVKKHKGTAKTMTWSNEAQETQASKGTRFFRMYGEDSFYYQSGSGIMLYDIATGEQLWEKSARATEQSMVVFDPKGMIVFAEKVYMYDYKTGEQIWDKPVKSKGAVNFYAYTPQGLVIGIEELNLRKVPYFELNCIDPDEGVFKFEKNYKINGNLLEMMSCDAGVMYTTDRELNIWNASTGEDAMTPIEVTATGNFFEIKSWDYSAPPNGRLLTGFKGSMAYVFNTETQHLYAVDTKTGQKKQLTANPLVFDDKTTAETLEIRPGGIFLASKHNATLLNFEGEEVFLVQLPKAKKGFVWKMMAAAANIYQHQREANDALRLSRPELAGSTPSMRAAYVQKLYGFEGVQIEVNVEAGKRILRDRFEQSKMGKYSYYIFSQLANHTGGWLDGEYGVVKVNKDTGEIEKYISFGNDITPNFTIDEISGRLFYASEGNWILCFDMN